MTERYKGHVHLLALVLGGTMLAYNLGMKNRFNSLLYSAYCIWEFKQVDKHYGAS